ncbi:MAG: hypothetical protein LUC21_02945 [Oscillospiraceae bacterium]|nr:hypothetical protein [Oscillospiraceae bacterium]MCC8090119.1 hypothetical protein [Oscillospiraceae bacterium]MCC8157361.1 hypothetical protein [Oscillospiraceae bacterium]MCD7742848.1 hypothetical protein [Oscillospiraceae bacterium]MCD7787193.1 hypothetical protein [Oscillospiraceae bacterium]
MEMHKIEYEIKLTGSKLFDVVMYNTAKKLCDDFPGLEFEYGEHEIKIFGELDDFWFQKYNETMFEKMGQL